MAETRKKRFSAYVLHGIVTVNREVPGPVAPSPPKARCGPRHIFPPWILNPSTACLRCLLCLLAVALSACPDSRKPSGPALSFVGASGTKSFDAKALAALAKPRELALTDPLFKQRKRYRAVPLLPLLKTALGLDSAALKGKTVLFVAADGYKVAVPGGRLLSGRPHVALSDLDHPPWQELPGHRGTTPGAFYLVWEASEAQDQKRFPWPWGLTTIRLAPQDLYAHTVPTSSAKDSAARRGHRVFLRDCVRCHAINQQGGTVGPDLNVPRNVLEYRDEAQLRAFIKNPASFRYGNMPAQAQLKGSELDDVIAYLRAMQAHKHDPHRRRETPKR